MTRDQLFISNSDVPSGLISNLTSRHRYLNRHRVFKAALNSHVSGAERGRKEGESVLHSEEICKGNRGFGYTLLHRSRSQAFVTRIICTEGGGFRDLNIRRDLDHFTWSFPREVTWGHEDRAPLNIHSPRV